MPDDLDAPVEQATAAPGEKRHTRDAQIKKQLADLLDACNVQAWEHVEKCDHPRVVQHEVRLHLIEVQR